MREKHLPPSSLVYYVLHQCTHGPWYILYLVLNESSRTIPGHYHPSHSDSLLLKLFCWKMSPFRISWNETP